MLLLGQSPLSIASQAVIVNIDGKVFVRNKPQSDWQDAKLNQSVLTDWEIKTQGESSCTLAFDSKRQNIVTVKDHSQIKLESIMPGKVFLAEGRVFALVKNLPENKKFEVRTLTAIAGARGTGWLTEYIAGATNISCFNDIVYVNSLNPSGVVTGQLDLNEGRQINVEDRAINAADVKDIKEADKKEWKQFESTAQQHALVPATDKNSTPAAPTAASPTAGQTQIGTSSNSTGGSAQPAPSSTDTGGQTPDATQSDQSSTDQSMAGDDTSGDYNPDMSYADYASTDSGVGYDASQLEALQTIIDTTLTQCGHLCCPYPNCCDDFSPTACTTYATCQFGGTDQQFCLAH